MIDAGSLRLQRKYKLEKLYVCVRLLAVCAATLGADMHSDGWTDGRTEGRIIKRLIGLGTSYYQHKIRPRNELLCFRRNEKLYSLSHSVSTRSQHTVS